LSRGPCSRYLPDPDDSCRFTFSRLLSVSRTLAELPLVAMAGAGLEATGVVGSWRAETDGESSTDADGRGGAGRAGRLVEVRERDRPVGRAYRSMEGKPRCRKRFCYAGGHNPRAVVSVM